MKALNTITAGMLAAAVLLSSCGTDLENGKKALESGDLAKAKGLLEAAVQKDPEAKEAGDLLTRTYALRAQNFVNKNYKRAQLFIEKAEETFDPSMSAETKGALAEYFLMVAAKLLEEGKQSKALENLEHAIAAYGPNEKLTTEFDKQKMAYADHMLSQGKTRYAEYKKTKDDFKLIYAESYLTFALKYNPALEEAQKLAAAIRKKTLQMANPEDRIPMAVTSVSRKAKETVLAIYIKCNHAALEVNTDPQNFVLILDGGEEYNPDPKLMEKYKALGTGTLKSGQEAEGVLVYPVAKDVKLTKLIYRGGQDFPVEKYFP